MARAAASTSLNVVSVFVASAGLTSTATRAAAGTSSRRSSSRFAANSPSKKLMPVRLPPGRARLATRPSLTGSSRDHEDDGDRRGRRLGRERRRGTSGRGDHGDLPANQIGRQRRQSIQLILGPAVFDRHVLALDIAGVLQALAKSAQTVRERVRRCGVEEPDHRHRRLLRARRERPRAPRRRASAMNSRRLNRSNCIRAAPARVRQHHIGLRGSSQALAALRHFGPAYRRFGSLASKAAEAVRPCTSATLPKADVNSPPWLPPLSAIALNRYAIAARCGST